MKQDIINPLDIILVHHFLLYFKRCSMEKKYSLKYLVFEKSSFLNEEWDLLVHIANDLYIKPYKLQKALAYIAIFISQY